VTYEAFGGAGNDAFALNTPHSIEHGNAGNDNLNGQAGDDRLWDVLGVKSAGAVDFLKVVSSHPSQSYTLSRLGASFPDFLEQTRPPESRATGGGADWPAFMIDLARLERIVNEVFDGPGAEGKPLLDATRLQAIPPDRWPAARLICVPSLRLMTVSHPVNDYFTAIRRGETPPIPEAKTAHVAVTRRDYRVRRYPLEAAQYELLRALIDQQPVGMAIGRAAAVATESDAQLADALRQWFRFWTAEGFFQDAVVD
jgi:hypothetical protein